MGEEESTGEERTAERQTHREGRATACTHTHVHTYTYALTHRYTLQEGPETHQGREQQGPGKLGCIGPFSDSRMVLP